MIALYCRVSTQEQAAEGYSIDEQLERLKKYCEAMGWKAFKPFVDAGFSGGNTNRPALQDMIAAIQAGKIEKVVVYKLDRLSRSQLDTLYLIERVFLANGVDFISMTENFDTSSPFGKAMMGILAVFAQLEREQIKERMMMGREARAKEGKFHGGIKPPIGYDYTDGKLVVNPAEAMQVREVYNKFVSGEPILQIMREMDEAGLAHHYGKWSTKAIHNALSNPLYIGSVRFNGNEYTGTHEPIIPLELFNAAQDRLAVRSNMFKRHNAVSGKHFLLGGLLWCSRCGARYGAHRIRKGKYDYSYYLCYSRSRQSISMIRAESCDNDIWRMDDLDGLVLAQIESLATDPEALEAASSKPHPDERLSMLEAALADVQRQKGRLLDLYAVKTAFTADELSSRVNPLVERETRLKGEIEALNAARGMDAQKAAELVSTFRDVIARNVFAEKRALMEALIDRIDIDGKEITIHWKF